MIENLILCLGNAVVQLSQGSVNHWSISYTNPAKYKRLKLQTRGSIAVTDQPKSKSDNHSLSSGYTVDQIDVVSTFTNTSSVFPKSKVNDINI